MDAKLVMPWCLRRKVCRACPCRFRDVQLQDKRRRSSRIAMVKSWMWCGGYILMPIIDTNWYQLIPIDTNWYHITPHVFGRNTRIGAVYCCLIGQVTPPLDWLRSKVGHKIVGFRCGTFPWTTAMQAEKSRAQADRGWQGGTWAGSPGRCGSTAVETSKQTAPGVSQIWSAQNHCETIGFLWSNEQCWKISCIPRWLDGFLF